MNQLAKLPEGHEPPPITAALRFCIAPPMRYRTSDAGEGDYILSARDPSRMDVFEARRVLPAYEAWSRPPVASDPEWQHEAMAWLANIVRGIGNPPPRDEMILRATAIVAACSDLPRAVWNEENAKIALQKFEWWGQINAASIHGFLAERAAPILAALNGLRRVAAFVIPEPPAPATEPPPDPEIITKLAQDAKGILGDYEAAIPKPPPPKARYAPDDILLRMYEADANDPSKPELSRALARTRVEMLRKKLGYAA